MRSRSPSTSSQSIATWCSPPALPAPVDPVADDLEQLVARRPVDAEGDPQIELALAAVRLHHPVDVHRARRHEGHAEQPLPARDGLVEVVDEDAEMVERRRRHQKKTASPPVRLNCAPVV